MHVIVLYTIDWQYTLQGCACPLMRILFLDERHYVVATSFIDMPLIRRMCLHAMYICGFAGIFTSLIKKLHHEEQSQRTHTAYQNIKMPCSRLSIDLVISTILQVLHQHIYSTIHSILITNWLKQPILLWTTIISVKLTEF